MTAGYSDADWKRKTMTCRKCSRILTGDEIAIHRKLLGLAEEKCYCKTCLAERFKCDERTIEMKIRQFREAGCYLFP